MTIEPTLRLVLASALVLGFADKAGSLGPARLLSLRAMVFIGTISYSLYLVMGWAAIIAGPALYHNLTGPQLGLIVAGGAASTLIMRWYCRNVLIMLS